MLKTPKTDTSERKVYIPGFVAQCLIDIKKEQDEVKEALGSEYTDYNLIMATTFGMPINGSYIRDQMQKVIDKEGLPDVIFHSLRHTSVTYKLKLSGGDIKAVQGDSGHAQADMVTEVYGHIIDEDRRKNAERMENAFYNKENLNPDIHEQKEEENKITIPEGVNPELLMKVLYIIHKYLEIKGGKKPARPLTFIFGAKAAPAYVIARDIIHLLLVLQQIINNDPDVKDYMKVVMVENYNVSYAEKLIPACDISEQISLASKEASGTGNMKMMLNGAVTLGTADGANVEIHDLVGDDNIYIFGENSEQVIDHYAKADYVSRSFYEKSPVIKAAVDFTVSDQALAVGHKENLERLYNELLNKDWFMTLLDLEDYIATKDRMFADYEDQEKWKRMMVVNIAKAGFFSSDRTIAEYNRDIWKLK